MAAPTSSTRVPDGLAGGVGLDLDGVVGIRDLQRDAAGEQCPGTARCAASTRLLVVAPVAARWSTNAARIATSATIPGTVAARQRARAARARTLGVMAKGKGGGRPPVGGGGGGQPNMQALMRQAQKMQQDMLAAQGQLAAATVEGSAGNGLVTAMVSGGGELLGLTVKPEVVDPEDVDTLVDLVIVAVQDAQAKASQLTEQTMGPLSAGLGGGGGLPGLPF